jgi:hypothetical protein
MLSFRSSRISARKPRTRFVRGCRLFNQGGDAGDVGLGNLGDVACPILPIVASPALLDDLRHDGLGKLVKEELPCTGSFGLMSAGSRSSSSAALPVANVGLAALFVGLGRQLVADGDDLDVVGNVHAKVGLVYHRVEPFVVRTQGIQNLPDDAVAFVVVQCLFRRHALRERRSAG